MSEINTKWVIFNLYEWAHFNSVCSDTNKCNIQGRNLIKEK